MENRRTLDVSKETKIISTQLEKLIHKYAEVRDKDLFDAITLLDSVLMSLKKVS